MPPPRGTPPAQTGDFCNWVPQPECVASFKYKEVEYTGCSTKDHGSGWCSEDSVYAGRWRECDQICSTQQLERKRKFEGTLRTTRTTTAVVIVEPSDKKELENLKEEDKEEEKEVEQRLKAKPRKDHQHQPMSVSDSKGWTCFHYTDNMWDTWCQAEPLQDGARYKFFQDLSTSPCGECHCCQKDVKRRLADEPSVEEEESAHESSRFFVTMPAGALPYKLDEHLLQALLDRGSIRDFKDGREQELGEARIIGFKIHRDNASRPEKRSESWPWSAGVAAAAMGVAMLTLANVRWICRHAHKATPAYSSIDPDGQAT